MQDAALVGMGEGVGDLGSEAGDFVVIAVFGLISQGGRRRGVVRLRGVQVCLDCNAGSAVAMHAGLSESSSTLVNRPVKRP